MATLNNSQAQSPIYKWIPMRILAWWITPRATERDERFREAVIRVSTLVLVGVVMIALFIIVPNFVGDEQTRTNRIVTLLTFIVLLLIPFFLAHRGQITIAGWALLMMPTFGFLTLATSIGLWMNLSIFFLLMTSLYGQVVLPRQQIKYLLVLNFALIFVVQLFPIPVVTLAESPAEILPDLLKQPISVLLTVIILIIVSILLYILRQEFDSRQEELRRFVAELDQRVQDRTKELEIARQKAEEANVIKTKFLANMSHELRTPLNAILNFTAFVADGIMGDVNEEQEEALRQSISSGKHLLSLINDILDVTKIEAGLMDLFIQEVDFNEVLNGVVAIGKGLSKDKPVELVTEIQPNLPKSYGDKRRMRQVFLNIVSNAFKFTREGSVIIRARSTDTHIHVQITDTGIGIAPENYQTVFEAFKQVQNESLEVVGTGLGMPISKYFVESHLGNIWFESEAGVGTTFFVELPILTEEQANALRFEAEGLA